MQNNSQTKSAVELAHIHSSHDNTTPSIPTKDGYRLNPDHYQEWLNSSVDKELIEANEIFSLDGDNVYEYLLAFHEAQRRNDGRLTNAELARHDHCRDGGYWFGSVDVRTGEDSDYGCFKPDNPRENPENGKPIKYESPLGSTPQLFAFHVPPSIWKKISDRYCVPIGVYTNIYKWIIDHPQIPLFITEGAKKVGCLLSMGYFAIGVSGVTHCYKTDKETGERTLHPDIEYFCNGNRHLYFGFDCDSNSKTRKTVHSIIRKTAGLIKEYNTNTKVFKVTWNGAKGVDDWLILNSPDRFHTQVKRAKQVYPIASDYDQQESKKQKRESFTQKQIAEIKEIEMDSLRFNEMKLRVEKDGETLDLDQYYLDLAEYHAIDISKEKAANIAIRIAKENSYHPVRDYLNEVSETVTPISLDNLSNRYFGTTDPIYDLMVKLKLIASVARVFQPGCKQDEALVLHGKTGILKSTWFKKLYGDEFFTDSYLGLEREGKMAMRRYWCVEWQELDAVTSKKEAGQIKSFLSTAVDVYRTPYARCDEDVPRTSVMVASVNTDDFLRDETGNRRYWIIPVNLPPGQKIDTTQIEKERDAIWSAAVQAYRNGHRWHMNILEEDQSEALNKDFLERDEWESTIEAFITGVDRVTIKKILTQALDLPIGQIQRREQLRVSRILRKLGWEYSQNKENYEGIRQKVWKRNVTLTTPTDPSQGHSQGQRLEPSNNGQTPHTDPDPPNSQCQLRVTPECKSDAGFQDPDPDFSKKVTNFGEGNEQYHPTKTNELNKTEKEQNPEAQQTVQTNHTVSSDLTPPQNKENFQGRQGHTHPKPSHDAGSDVTLKVTPSVTPSSEWNDIIAEIDQQMKRIGWSNNEGQRYLQEKYGVRARVQLTDKQLFQFLDTLKSQPSLSVEG